MNTRAMYWSVRRELWESRSIYIAPLIVAVVMVLGFLIAAIAHLSKNTLRFDLQADKLVQPFNFAAILMMGIMFIVAVFYCLDALNGERRDRSVLFWKSMPVSDVTTVLSKAAIPLIVLPVVTFALTIVTQVIMLVLDSALALISGQSAAALWTQLPWFQMSGMLLYHLLSVHALYYAPIFGWLLLVSAAVKRAPILWAVIPLAAIGIIEKMAFNTSHFGVMLASRLGGGAKAGEVQGGG